MCWRIVSLLMALCLHELIVIAIYTARLAWPGDAPMCSGPGDEASLFIFLSSVVISISRRQMTLQTDSRVKKA